MAQACGYVRGEARRVEFHLVQPEWYQLVGRIGCAAESVNVAGMTLS